MTTRVIVQAHCADDVAVEVRIWEGHEDPEGPELHYLKHGDEQEFYVYDERSIDVCEIAITD